MTQLTTPPSCTVTSHEVEQYLHALQLAFIAEHDGEPAQHAVHKQWSHLDHLGHLVAGEALLRQDRATTNRIGLARFPVLKTPDQFRWDWPMQINRALIQHHFTLSFLKLRCGQVAQGPGEPLSTRWHRHHAILGAQGGEPWIASRCGHARVPRCVRPSSWASARPSRRPVQN